jgi:CIC family chloride channel protein
LLKKNIFEKGLENLQGEMENRERLFLTLMAIIIGVIGGYAATLLRILIENVESIHEFLWHNMFHFVESENIFLRCVPPLVGLSLVIPFVHYLAKEAKGTGIPHVMESMAIKGGYIRARVLFVKIIATAITLGSGGSAGMEGPAVQIGASAGSSMGQLSKASRRRMRIMVACGASAAIAGTFNAPIAGVLFSLEVLISDYGVMTLSPIVLSSVMGTVISRMHLGDSVAIAIPDALKMFHWASPWEIGTFLLLGLFTGALGVLFSKTVYGVDDIFDAVKLPLWLKTILGIVLICAIIIAVPNVAGDGADTIDSMLRGDLTTVLQANSLDSLASHTLFILVIYFLAKSVATALTFSVGASGGVFGPCLFLGAVAGFFAGTVFKMSLGDMVSDPAVYTLVGIGSLVAGATHTPMTSILILFEMTGDYRIILPVMLACISSSLVATALDADSIFTKKLARKGINIKRGRDQDVLKSITVEQIMTKEFVSINQRTRYPEVLGIINDNSQLYYPVTDDSGEMVGILSFTDIRDHILSPEVAEMVIAKDLAVPGVVRLRADMSMHDAFDIFYRLDKEQLPVVSVDDDHKVVGLVSRRELLNYYNRAILRKDVLQQSMRDG